MLVGKRGIPTTEQSTHPPLVTRNPIKPTRDPSVPNACTTSFDTLFMDPSEKTFAFKDKHYWVISRKLGLESGPHKISSRWRELRTPVNAAFTRKDRKTVFFTGSR